MKYNKIDCGIMCETENLYKLKGMTTLTGERRINTCSECREQQLRCDGPLPVVNSECSGSASGTRIPYKKHMFRVKGV